MDIAEIKKLPRNKVGKTLSNEFNSGGTLVTVDEYHDANAKRVYQVDEHNRRYREADSSTVGSYGPWQVW